MPSELDDSLLGLPEEFEVFQEECEIYSTPLVAAPVSQGALGTPSRLLPAPREAGPGRKRVLVPSPKKTCSHNDCQKKQQVFESDELLEQHLRKHLERDAIRKLPVDSEVLRKVVVLLVEHIKLKATEAQEEGTKTKGGQDRFRLIELLHKEMKEATPAVFFFLGRISDFVGSCVTKMRDSQSIDVMTQTVLMAQSRALANRAQHSELVEALEGCVEVPPEINYQVRPFIASLVLDICVATVQWCVGLCKEELSGLPKKAKYTTSVSSTIPLPMSERQAVHYIAGASIKKAEKRQRRSKTLLPEAQAIPHLIEGSGRVADEVAAFTVDKSYGGLVFCGVRYFQFARDLLILIKGEHDLSKLSYEYVLQKVRGDKTFVDKWESIFTDKESPETKDCVLRFAVETLVTTFLKGIINLLENCSVGVALQSQALRPGLKGQAASVKHRKR